MRPWSWCGSTSTHSARTWNMKIYRSCSTSCSTKSTTTVTSTSKCPRVTKTMNMQFAKMLKKAFSGPTAWTASTEPMLCSQFLQDNSCLHGSTNLASSTAEGEALPSKNCQIPCRKFSEVTGPKMQMQSVFSILELLPWKLILLPLESAPLEVLLMTVILALNVGFWETSTMPEIRTTLTSVWEKSSRRRAKPKSFDTQHAMPSMFWSSW